MAARVLCALALAWTGAAAALELPLWEAGAGFSGLLLPDYRGSNQVRGYVYPVPYLVYRGDRFRIDRDRIREFLFNSDRLELELNLNADVPVNSNRNNARRGMPDLDAVVEAGPALRFSAYKSTDATREFSIRLPARGAMATSGRFIGWVFEPGVAMDWHKVNLAGSGGWNLSVAATWIANTRHYDNYYYSVDPAYASTERAAYSAPGGAAGEQITFALSKRFPALWVGAFMHYDTLHGARFDQSPLVRTRQEAAAGFAVAWVFGRSKETVDAPN